MGLAMLEPSPLLIAPGPGLIILGWVLITLGGITIVVALTSIRWRAVVPSNRDTLVQNGLYAVVRHPIHGGTLLEFVGLFLLKPTQTFTLACALGILWLFIQSRLEEIDLLQRNPDYAGYMQRVPAFWPRLRRSKKG
jgi:protein-S-isoprenylcysteine O-methyltransferase Ste14